MFDCTCDDRLPRILAEPEDQEEALYSVLTAFLYWLRPPRPLTLELGEPDDAYPQLW